MPNMPNQLLQRKSEIRRDIFDMDRIATRSETVSPDETFPIDAGTVMGRVTSSGMLKRYDAGATDGTEVAVGMLLQEVVQPIETLQTGEPVARMVSLVYWGLAPNANGISNLDNAARAQLASVGLHAYRNADVGL